MTVHVTTFYRFVEVDDPFELRRQLSEFASAHGLTGTILIANEGINATIAGDAAGIAALVALLEADPRFASLRVAHSTAEMTPFGRLKVRVKREIVTFGARGGPSSMPTSAVFPIATGTKVAPADWNSLIADPDVLLIDTRNTYEIAIGTFPGAVDPGTTKFSEFKEFVAGRLDGQRDRRIAMFCTGGIRCEKASSLLLSQGFRDVHQLEGGILAYLATVPQEVSRWRGDCYVFDGRVGLAVGLARGNHVLCKACGSAVTQNVGCQRIACIGAGTLMDRPEDARSTPAT